MRAFVFDLLTLCGCRHLDQKCVDIDNEIYKSDCLNQIRSAVSKSIRELGIGKSKSPQESAVIYISEKSYDRLIKSNVLKILAKHNIESKSIQYVPWIILRDIHILITKSHWSIELVKHHGDCELSGPHDVEYCDLREALSKALKSCNLQCGIICVDKTFSENDLLSLARELRVELSINPLANPQNARIVEFEKRST